MKKILLFDGIYPSELKALSKCLNAREVRYPEGKVLDLYRTGDTRLGLLVSGSAEIFNTDSAGRRNVFRLLQSGEPFGNIFNFFAESSLELVTLTECTIIYYDYDKIMKPCSEACTYHARFVSNMVRILSSMAAEISQRLKILSQRTTQAKLMAYFEQLSREQNSRIIRMPMSFSSLADYLFIDRSAMQRELKKMRMEGILSTQGSLVRLSNPSHAQEDDY